MKVQEFLKERGVEALTEELGIVAKHHETLPLMILNYSQIESPKTHPIVRECRGLILRSDDFSLVARSFNRFFNWGEVQEDMKDFDFSNFCVQTKEDGSLVLVFNFEGQWHVATRGSFADGKLNGFDGTWAEAIMAGMGVSDLSDLDEYLNRYVCYVCEFCGPWNKVVRSYQRPVLHFLTAFRGEHELTQDELAMQWDNGAGSIFSPLNHHDFDSIDAIRDFLKFTSEQDPTFEGVVIKDGDGRRWKIKSPTYLAFHQMRGEGDNIYSPKHLLPFILKGEESELLTYFPEVGPTFYETKSKVLDAYAKLLQAWGDHRHIEDQKEFALAVKDRPFAAILFTVRKKLGKLQRAHDIEAEWRNSADLILKKLFLKGV